MWKLWLALLAVGTLLWGGTPHAHGQKAAEMFIPMGQSPGLSGKVTVMGKIEAIHPQERTISIAGPSATLSARVTDRTQIWLDRSRLRQTNQAGSFADLRVGRTVEVKYEEGQRRGEGPAEWIKVQPEAR